MLSSSEHKNSKRCCHCKEDKPLSEFQRNVSRPDGLQHNCRMCATLFSLKYAKHNPEKVNEKNRRWRKLHPEYVKAYAIAYKKTDVGKASISRSIEKYRTKNQKKYRVRQDTSYAIRTGKLIRESCNICGALETEGHHDDYAKPLEIRWLCRIHHKQWHADNGPGHNGDD